MNLQSVMEALYQSEINCCIDSFWDGGWSVSLGLAGLDGCVAGTTFYTLDECARWLYENARKQYPNSRFAKEYVPSGSNH